METITIRISATDQGGYMYDIWKGDQVSEDAPDSDDGGQCTTTMLNALKMAAGQAEDIIKDEKGEECPGCLERDLTKTQGVALSRYGHGDICPDCGTQEALEGDFIGAR